MLCTIVTVVMFKVWWASKQALLVRSSRPTLWMVLFARDLMDVSSDKSSMRFPSVRPFLRMADPTSCPSKLNAHDLWLACSCKIHNRVVWCADSSVCQSKSSTHAARSPMHPVSMASASSSYTGEDDHSAMSGTYIQPHSELRVHRMYLMQQNS